MEIENTVEAFSAAGERSYYGIEADVRRTADGKFVICHDENLKRISGNNLKVESSTFDELMKVTLYSQNKSKQGKLCELSTYISLCKSYGKQAILELKSEFTEKEVTEIVEVIDSYDYLEYVTFISFHYKNLEYIRKILRSQSVQYLFSKLSDEIVEQLVRDKIDAAISYKVLTKAALDSFHNAGLVVNCWTVDDKRVAEKLAAWGVDYITTNILE